MHKASTDCLDPSPNKIPTIVFFGRTGAGKSTLCNQIAGRKIFEEGHSLDSKTDRPLSEIVTWPQDPSKKIRLVDTPGFGDNTNNLTNEQSISIILKFLESLEGGFNIGIFCTNGNTRVDAHDIQELNLLSLLMGNHVFKHTFIAVTQTNTLKPEERQKVFNTYPSQMPEILAKHGMLWLGSDKILFADFQIFEEAFLKPMDNIIKTTPFYNPTLPTGVDLNNAESIRLLILNSKIQEQFQKEQALLEKRRLLNEHTQELLSYENQIQQKSQQKQRLVVEMEQNEISLRQKSVDTDQKRQSVIQEEDQKRSSLEQQKTQLEIQIQQINQVLNQKLMSHQDLVIALKQKEEELLSRRHHHHGRHGHHGHHGHHGRHGHHGHHHGRHGGRREEIARLKQQVEQSRGEYEGQERQSQNQIGELRGRIQQTLNELTQVQDQSRRNLGHVSSELEQKQNEVRQRNQAIKREIDQIIQEIASLSQKKDSVVPKIQQIQTEIKSMETN